MIRSFSFLKSQISNFSISFILILHNFHDTTHLELKYMLTLTSFPSDLFQRHLNVILTTNGGMSTTLVRSKIKCFVTLINYFQIMTNVIVSFDLFVLGLQWRVLCWSCIIFPLAIYIGFFCCNISGLLVCQFEIKTN